MDSPILMIVVFVIARISDLETSEEMTMVGEDKKGPSSLYMGTRP